MKLEVRRVLALNGGLQPSTFSLGFFQDFRECFAVSRSSSSGLHVTRRRPFERNVQGIGKKEAKLNLINFLFWVLRFNLVFPASFWVFFFLARLPVRSGVLIRSKSLSFNELNGTVFVSQLFPVVVRRSTDSVVDTEARRERERAGNNFLIKQSVFLGSTDETEKKCSTANKRKHPLNVKHVSAEAKYIYFEIPFLPDSVHRVEVLGGFPRARIVPEHYVARGYNPKHCGPV